MTIEVKYSIGDRVKFRHSVSDIDLIPCTFCNCTGKVTGADGTTDDCPRCDGRSAIQEEYDAIKEFEGIIKRIELHMDGKKEPYVLYQMEGWKWSYSWIAESQILEVIK